MPEKEAFYRYTGEVRTSGTGRSQQRTNIVSEVSNYEFIPWRLDRLVAGTGQGMKLAPKADVLASYWKAFERISAYHVHFAANATQLLVTKTGDKTVGVHAQSKGHLVLLPNLHWKVSALLNKDGTEWNKAAHTLALSLRNEILALDGALRSGSQTTPEPSWAQSSEFRLTIEDEIETKIAHITNRIESSIKQREELRSQLKKSTSLRALLFEKGPALEAAVREALAVLGFSADNFKDGNSEFDAVFESAEGRFLGEVEGRDNKPLAIEKYSQLERNINEDFQRDDVATPAKAVLFGNAYRLTPVSDRGDFFTDKVRSAAARTGAALVRTPDLFAVARYLKNTPDLEFALQCRAAIAAAHGAVVTFPAPPVEGSITKEQAA